ncbi:hypothetical protein [Fuerstiella marisgermanici]|uniref:Uncharacterized protein n=1 Tax=Fuerstiella marisgermanici TaxID=1891926 RepID=A0A1P8WJW6_9PLAN|nr:hypothetical protein [Fuerstiella marisgermanici]APZ94347.1 hypothetical protein Fuma_03975 [Fuerstiella marisgermanici]
MSQAMKDRCIPLVALLLGVAVVYAFGAWQHRVQAAAEAEVRDKFEALDAVEQERLLNRADGMNSNRETSPEQFDRLQDIHASLQADPKLQDKLKRLHAWWLTLDVDDKNKLKPSGNEFVEDWVDRVEEVYFETRNKPGQFVIKFRSRSPFAGRHELFRTDERVFQQFLDEVLPEDQRPQELKTQLAGLSGADQGSERALAIMIWLQKKLALGFGRSDENPVDNSLVSRIESAVSDTLILSSDRERFDQFRTEFTSGESPDRSGGWQRMWPRILAMTVLHQAMDYYYSLFRIKHLSGQRDVLIAMFDELDRSEQVELMSRDAREAEKNLERRLIEQTSAKDPAVAAIAEDLQNIRDNYRQMFSGRSRNRGRPGSGPPRGGRPGEERRDGRSEPRRDGSPRNESGGRERGSDNRDRNPGQRGGDDR